MDFAHLPFSLRQWQYAVAVADTGRFRTAASRCYVSQPSLSTQIAQLEETLGVKLFHRHRSGVLTTPAGQPLIERARRLLVDASALIDLASSMADPWSGTLRLGVIPTISPYFLPELAPVLRSAYPRLTVRYVEDKTAALTSYLERGELDGALLALEAEIGDVEHAVIGRDPFVLVAPPGHRLARGKRPVRMDALAEERVYVLADGHCFGEQARSLCAHTGANEDSFMATSLTTVVQMARSGDGLTLLPELAVPVENRVGDMTVRRFTKPAPYRTLVLVWRRGSSLAAVLRELATTCQRAYGDER